MADTAGLNDSEMLMPLKTPALASLLALALPSAACATDQLWTAVTLNGPVQDGGRALVWFDGQARFEDVGERRDVTIFRPGVGWRVSPKLDVWAGYARVATARPGPDLIENRAWQQATYPVGDVLGGRLTGRTRLEQRFRDEGDDAGWRVRQLVRWSRPVAKQVDLVMSNEAFLGLNDADWGQRDGFDQNRAFVGAAWRATPKVRIEGGYLNQFIDGGPGRDRVNDNISLAVFLTP